MALRKRRRKNINKANSLLRHSKRRASERYGVNIGRAGLWDIVNKIRSGRAIFIRKETNRISEWKVEHGGVLMRVIYDRRRKMVVTFLPPEGCSFGHEPEPILGMHAEEEIEIPEDGLIGSKFWEEEAEAVINE